MKFLIKKFSLIILIISFLLLIYTFYKSEFIWDGNKRNYYITYYFISLILIFFSIITFFIDYKKKEYLIISGISLVVSLYLFEGYLTFKKQLSIKEQLSKEQLYEEQTGNKWDRRHKLDIYNELKKNNNEVTVSFSPKYFVNKNHSTIPFPLSGLSNSETIHCNENGYFSIYQSDRYGFNNPDSEWDKKEIEYLLIGDSYAQGACVNRPYDISSVLRRITNKSVLNLGMEGNGPLIEYATFKEYFNKSIKKVLWIYFEGNDFYNLHLELKNKILQKYLVNIDTTQNIKFRQNEIDTLLKKIIGEEKKNKKITKKNVVFFLKLNKTRSVLNNYLPEDQQSEFKVSKFEIKKFKKILNLTKNLVNQNNSKLYFVYLPEYSRYKLTYDNTNYNLVKNIVTELKIPFIDIHKEVFEKEQNPLNLFPFKLHGHYNVNGYKKVAESIYKFSKD